MTKELFVCDSCGARTRLNSAQRHWCGACNKGAPVEMRYGKNKKPIILDRVADDIIMREGATVQSFQSAYHERDFALHAPASSAREVAATSTKTINAARRANSLLDMR